MVVKEVDKYLVVANPTAGDEWVLEVLIGHCIIIDAKILINIELVLFDLPPSSSRLAKCTESELSIIGVDDGVLGTTVVLLDFFNLNVMLCVPPVTYLLLKSKLVSVQVIHLNERFVIIVSSHCNCAGRVI